MEYHGKFGHTLVQIHNISLMIKIEICYTDFIMATQTVSPTLPGFQCIKVCIKYLSSQPTKKIFYPSN